MTNESRPNRLTRTLARLDKVPAMLRPHLRNLVLRRAVPFTGTARLDFAVMTPEKVEIAIANQRRVQRRRSRGDGLSIIGACLFSLASSNCRSANEPVQVRPAQSNSVPQRQAGMLTAQ